jgi:hypothetical protein
MCTAAQQMEFLSLSLELQDSTGHARTLTWQSPDNSHPSHQRINMGIPIRHPAHPSRESAPPSRTAASQGSIPTSTMRANAEVFVNGSVESAGRRIALFGRLLDEHGLASLQLPTPPPSGETAKTAK